ncbi:MAG TPA: hypothetical protein VFB67_02490 [Candidatus Polarisedimenticolaceae bacterium]|nr:hypothetical protein [Candidatus Polarisedimenticolaceae bacterium]
MNGRQRAASILIGVAGSVASMLALAAFLRKMHRNDLELPLAPTSQAVYRSVGEAYTGGFTAGFSLCFFLVLLAVAVGTWYESRRARHAADAPPGS